MTNPGLTHSEVAARVAAGQVNTLPPRSGRTSWDIVKANVFTRINALLLVLFVMVISTGSFINSFFGLFIIANSGIGIIQELRAKRTLDSLAVVGEGHSSVRRDGKVAELAREQIVLDDIIEIAPGDQIVVDGQVLEASYLEVDESLLTGESDPVVKTAGDELMSGSHVISGAGAFIVTKVGTDSYATGLTAQANKFTLTHSELQSGINVILKIITWLMIPVGIATIVVQSLQGGSWQQIILRMSGALVPMVPEGLVFLTSAAFAAAVIRLGRQKVLIQEMPAVEGLARVDVVCADKTGTLTENGLRFADLVLVGDMDETSCREALAQFAAADITPNASMRAISHELTSPAMRWEVAAMAPFTSAKKWSGISFVSGANNLVLGAPDVLAAPGSQVALIADEIGATGRRVLLLGQGEHLVDAAQAPGTVTALALVVLEQHVRPEAKDTLAFFRAQDVTVKVISGDNAKSVGAIMESLGMDVGAVVDARQLENLDDAAFAAVVDEKGVFGRVTPQQKRQMVTALQSKGHKVAMTGDGVNDVLAIKESDLGVAMGSGAAATRAVAQVVLLNDSFASLPSVVAEGRRVIGNIERVANFFLSKTMYSILLALFVAIGHFAFPFVPIQITLVGWFTIGVPAAILALAPSVERARPHFLKRVLTFGIPAGVIVAVTVFISYLLVLPADDAPHQQWVQASTSALITLLMGGIWIMVVNSRPYVWWKIVMIVGCFSAYVLIFSLPLGQHFFSIDISHPDVLTNGLVIGVVSLALIEALWWAVGWVTKEPRRLFAAR
ncbi:MAG: HAD-IC family P-type ATPase [Propionibacteriaceae bacterium]|nr:HAD-IC family P-type ATPase [Propionibacteriaceae bacterium]